MSDELDLTVSVNGRTIATRVEPRLLLSDFLRHRLGLTGTHVGCEHGACGACTVMVDGEPVCSCLMFAIQADGAELRTVEDIAPEGGDLHPLQAAFHAEHGLQCGFCTPGFLISALALLEREPDPSDDQIVDALSGNLCRCTGYRNITRAVRRAAGTTRGAPSP